MHQQFFGQPFPTQSAWGNQPWQQPGINVAEIVSVLSRIAPLLQQQTPFQSPLSQFGQQTPFLPPQVASVLSQLTPYLQSNPYPQSNPFTQGQFGQQPFTPQPVIGSVLSQLTPYLQQQGQYGQQTPFGQQGVYEIVNAIARILPVLQHSQQPFGTGINPGVFSSPYGH